MKAISGSSFLLWDYKSDDLEAFRARCIEAERAGEVIKITRSQPPEKTVFLVPDCVRLEFVQP